MNKEQRIEQENEEMKKQDILDALEGTEVLSVQFEGCVGISNGQIIRYGEVICAKPTMKQLTTLLHEAVENEFGYGYDFTKEI